ncbi:hypothetical protein FQN49_008531 [Arthroderma sp. PD_2]|nr:hypothetical protein FQN49_008531 [Arthroderma sp. PD_2]
MSGLRSHSAGILARWKWLQENWDGLTKRLPPAFSMLGSVIQIAAASLCTAEQMKEVEQFFKDKDQKGYDRSLEQSLDAIRAKTGWLARDREDVESWLKSNGYKA